MPLALTCDCGARFDADDLLAGKAVPCPECRQPVQAPARAKTRPQTTMWALASVVLALVGAFTLLGTALAILTGLLALLVIRRQPERFTGSALALCGIGGGVVFSLLTLGLLARPDLLPLAGWLRQRSLAGQIDTTGSLEMITRSNDLLIDRPSHEWGRARNDHTDDPAVGELQQKLDLLLVHVGRHAYVDVIRDTTNNNRSLDSYREVLSQTLNPPRTPLLGRDESSRRWAFGIPEETTGPFPPILKKRTDLAPVDGYDAVEWQVEQARGGQTWWFIIRAYKKAGSPIYVVRAYTRKRQKDANEEELRLILDSVHFESKRRSDPQ
jgi:hypothetical protein